MTPIELAAMLDHSVLKPEATEHDVLSGADTVRQWSIGFYCVQPCWVTLAAQSLAGTSARWSASSAFRTAAIARR